MPEADQLEMLDDEEPMFMTDEMLDRRLVQLENGLSDMSARLPAMVRAVAVIRRWLVRAEVRESGSASRSVAEEQQVGHGHEPALGIVDQAK